MYTYTVRHTIYDIWIDMAYHTYTVSIHPLELCLRPHLDVFRLTFLALGHFRGLIRLFPHLQGLLKPSPEPKNRPFRLLVE